MDWMRSLSAGVREALERGIPCKVAVHSEAQAELGRRAAERMSRCGAKNLIFRVIPENEQGQYPIGAILVP